MKETLQEGEVGVSKNGRESTTFGPEPALLENSSCFLVRIEEDFKCIGGPGARGENNLSLF